LLLHDHNSTNIPIPAGVRLAIAARCPSGNAWSAKATAPHQSSTATASSLEEHSPPFLAWLAAPVALVALLAALMTVSGWRPVTRGSSETRQAIQTALDRTAAAIPTPSIATLAAPSAPTPEVRRALPVPVTVKRATLWRLPEQERGRYQWYELPSAWGGGRVWARYCGTVEHFRQIPPNPVLGDLWNVTETNASWIYCVPTGYNHAVWIDP
jgi:hypothetical protein